MDRDISPEEAFYQRLVGKADAALLDRPVPLRIVYRLLAGMMAGQAATNKALQERLTALEGHGLRYEGTHQRAQAYMPGSVVTHAGSAWVALKHVPAGAVPGQSDAWQLMVKAGRDAR